MFIALFKRIHRFYRDVSRPLRHRMQKWRWPRSLTLDFYWGFLKEFLTAFWRTFQLRRGRNFCLGLPAVLLGIAACLIGAFAHAHRKHVDQDYWNDAQIALQQKDHTRAALLLNRVLKGNSARGDDARFALAVLYDDAGAKDRAAALFRVIAPDNAQRHRGAHRRLAIILSDSISLESSPEDLKRFHWHLKAARDEISPQMSLAWGRYSVAIRDLIAARKYFRVAVEEYPELWQTLAEIEVKFGDNASAQRNFEKASEYLAKRLQDSPGDHLARIDYAQVLMKLGRLDDARIVLEEGERLHPDGQWNWLLASLAVNFHDVLAVQGRSISELLAQLSRALTYEPNHGPALNRLMAYARANVEGNGDLRSILARVIAEGEQPALAHLAMGNLCWLEGDRQTAAFHFERAMDIREDMAVVLNNLAWLISHDEEPDFERALGLVNSALEERPSFPSFLDTRGTIYFLQEKWNEALQDIEPALSGLKDKSEGHRKLAKIYEELGHREISEEHRRLADEVAEEAPAATNG